METTVVAMTDYSFPSGHTVAATVFFGLFATIIVSLVTTKRLKFTVTFSTIGMVLAVALSRVYLRVHYLSDVLAGIALGVGGFPCHSQSAGRFGVSLNGGNLHRLYRRSGKIDPRNDTQITQSSFF